MRRPGLKPCRAAVALGAAAALAALGALAPNVARQARAAERGAEGLSTPLHALASMPPAPVAGAAGCPAPPAPVHGRRAIARAQRTLAADQQNCIAARVARFAPRVPGTTNVFFVGFAGYGEQRVFRREAELARRVFGEQLGSLDRSLELVNDVRDRTTYPLATFDNLRYALNLIGQRMNRQEDVLVLVLTSHGSPDDGIAITNGQLVDDALSPRDVRRILNEAGIRWRVLVASACYAGIFVRPLETDTSLILTAADSRHSSFGCADDRDLTYFGEALLADAMPRACSLEDAFAAARRIIRERESAEGEIHSNPQIYVGARMRAKLRGLVRERAVAARLQRCLDPHTSRASARSSYR